jgi:hypothetical protein
MYSPICTPTAQVTTTTDFLLPLSPSVPLTAA